MPDNEKLDEMETENVAGGGLDLQKSKNESSDDPLAICTCQFCGKKFRARSWDDIPRERNASMPGIYWLTNTCRDCELNKSWKNND